MRRPSLAIRAVHWACAPALALLVAACARGAAPISLNAPGEPPRGGASSAAAPEPAKRPANAVVERGAKDEDSPEGARIVSLGSVTARLTPAGVLSVGRATLQIGPRDPDELPEGHWRRSDRAEHPAVTEEEKLVFELVSFRGGELAVYVREFAGANADTIVFLHTVALIKDGGLVRVFSENAFDPRKRRLAFPGDGTAVWRDAGTVLRVSPDGSRLVEASR